MGGSQPVRSFRIVGSSKDQKGIVARVATFIAEQGGSILQANQFEDIENSRFFFRYVIDARDIHDDVDGFKGNFDSVADQLGMSLKVVDVSYIPRVVMLVSKHDHCLAYLLHRWKVGDLRCEIPCVISNHEDLRELVEWYGIPYHYIPVGRESAVKEEAFREIAAALESASPDTIVLARYMQILPSWLCSKYLNRIINIHHSFLPSFAGANPYRQARERGVKLTGATCHYVTADLDEGPIIDQDVVRIRHNDSVEDMMRLGKDIENVVLARGLRFHLEDRVIVDGNKTIIFY